MRSKMLFNAHQSSQQLLTPTTRWARRGLEAIREQDRWKYRYSPDIVDFVRRHNLRGKQKQELLRNPSAYFSKPSNVPSSSRQQIYLPNITMSLMRTPHLPPKYACFWVPLWFNKLDMKDYMNRVYGVGVVHVRSSVQIQPVYRVQVPVRGRRGVVPGSLKRPMSKKKMTVQLEEPFVWPEEVEDFTPFEQETYKKISKEKETRQKAVNDPLANPTLEPERQSIAEQAKAVLRGRIAWKPTWQSIPLNQKAMERPLPRP